MPTTFCPQGDQERGNRREWNEARFWKKPAREAGHSELEGQGMRVVAQESGPVWPAPMNGREINTEGESQATTGGHSPPFKAPHYSNRKPHYCPSNGMGSEPSTLNHLKSTCGFSIRGGESTPAWTPPQLRPTPTVFCALPFHSALRQQLTHRAYSVSSTCVYTYKCVYTCKYIIYTYLLLTTKLYGRYDYSISSVSVRLSVAQGDYLKLPKVIQN